MTARPAPVASGLVALLESRRLLWALVLLLLAAKQLVLLSTLELGRDVSTMSFAFGGYIEGLIERGQFSSCAEDRCEHASRMPLLPLVSAALATISRDMLIVGMLKNVLLSGLFLVGVHFILRHAGTLRQSIAVTANLGLLFVVTSPALIKHAGMPLYEEGYLVEMLFLYWLCFMILLVSVFDRRIDVGKANIAGLFVLLGVMQFLLKETMISLMVVMAVGLAILAAVEGRRLINPAALGLMAAGALSLAGWVAYNSAHAGSLAVFTTFNGENRFNGANPYTMALYPDISPDRIYDSDRAVLRDGTVIELPKQRLRHEFPTDRAWDAYYRDKAKTWIREHPDQWRAFTIEKIENFFLSIEKTPYSTAAIYAPPQGLTKQLYDGAVAVWLVWGRVLQAIFAGIALLALVRGPWTVRFLTLGCVLGALAYASPYLVGFNYERHISPYLLLLALSTVFLASPAHRVLTGRQQEPPTGEMT